MEEVVGPMEVLVRLLEAQLDHTEVLEQVELMEALMAETATLLIMLQPEEL
jgi:hypothetical protein